MKLCKTSIYLFVFCIWVSSFIGCATAPVRGALPTYNINGVTYLSLAPLCDSKNVSWEYDKYSRTANLTKGEHRVNLRVGDTLVLVDGRSERLAHPVEMYKGAIAVPYKFQERFIDIFAKAEIAPPPFLAGMSRVKRIVIDSGHGGNDPGAVGRSGLREKDINLDIAKRVAKLLKEEGVEIVMTRSTDKFIPLPRRVDIANDSRADLFVSIHTNANRVRSLNGFEVYYVSPYAGDTKRALSAAKDGKLRCDTSYISDPTMNLKAVLWDMLYTSDRAESIELAGSICRIIGNNMNSRVIGVKSANFYVLKGARMPAVLVEIGFISNRNEERLLKNNYYRQQIADAISRGILDYARDYTYMRQVKQ